jgi:aspartyl/asparaginyl beta-hydroxylase (cupin superfamily)
MGTSARFFEERDFPHLVAIGEDWEAIRDEAIGASALMQHIGDQRAESGTWSILPLLAEQRDREVFPDSTCRRNLRSTPITARLLDSTPGVRAAAFSTLDGGSRIAPHRHSESNVTASLCLDGGENAFLTVGGETRSYADGTWSIFDYTQEHSVINRGTVSRTVLLLAFANPRDSG